MSQNARRSEHVVFTVGHSNHPIETFIGLLSGRGIQVVADTRSYPYSRFAPQFNREDLKAAITAEGIRYVFLGKELGGRPEADEFYDEDERVNYARVAGSQAFRDGISRLRKGIGEHRVALLCSEENPEECHRRLLVGRVLGQAGVAVWHIRGDGSVQSEGDLKPADGQPSLFGDEEPEWKSTRSVLRRRRPSGSSAL